MSIKCVHFHLKDVIFTAFAHMQYVTKIYGWKKLERHSADVFVTVMILHVCVNLFGSVKKL